MLNISSISDLEVSHKPLAKNGLGSIDIQTISNDALEKIFQERYLLHARIPEKSKVIGEENQTDYFKHIKESVIQRLQSTRFSIITGPTGTGKTTLIRTIAYEQGVDFYEEIGDHDKTINTFLQEVKTENKKTIQVKTIPGSLLKALTRGGIYVINEANTLPEDVIIGLANMVENGFVVWQGKKFKIHDNFSLAFTSNEGYLGAKDYNSAILRKAGGPIELGYETDVNEEGKVVSHIYQKIKNDIGTVKFLSDHTLEQITQSVFKTRSVLKNNSEKFYSEDIAPYYHFFYIRLYEMVIGELLLKEKGQHSLSKIILDCLPMLPQQVGGQLMGGEMKGIFLNNKKTFIKIIEKSIQGTSVTLESVDAPKGFFPTSDKYHKKAMELNPGYLERFNALSDEEKAALAPQNHQKNIGINPNLFKMTLSTEMKSKGEELKRPEHIEYLAQKLYMGLVDTSTQKTIIIGFYKEEGLYIKIGRDEFCLSTDKNKIKTQLEELSKTNNIDDFTELVFGNTDIIVQKKGDDGVFEKSEHGFSSPKSLEIRRRSKILQFEKDGENYVALLGMKGNVKDIRYEDENGKFFIPQSKTSDLIYSLYRVTENIPEKGHFLTLGKSNNLKYKTSGYLYHIYDIDQKYPLYDIEDIEDKVLQRIDSQEEIYHQFDTELRQRFANIDTLHLRNGGTETTHTATPSAIIGAQCDIQSAIWDHLGRKLDFITESTEKVLKSILNAHILGHPVLLTGGSGVGKTSVAKKIAEQLGLPYNSFQVPEDFSETDIKAQYEWNEGAIEEAILPFFNYYINGGVLELKEINMATYSTFLNQYIDADGTVLYKGERYMRHPNFLIIATRNYVDPILYAGTKPMNTALIARFREIEVLPLPRKEIQELLYLYTNLDEFSSLRKQVDEIQFENIINQTLDLMEGIRTRISELQETQDGITGEELKIFARLNLTVDKLIYMITQSSNIEEYQINLKGVLHVEPEWLEIVSPTGKGILESILRL